MIPLTTTLSAGSTEVLVTFVVAIITILAAVAKVWQMSVRMASRWDDLRALVEDNTAITRKSEALTNHELNHNSGTSVKDKAYEAAASAREASQSARAAEHSARKAEQTSELALANTEFIKNQFSAFTEASEHERKMTFFLIDQIKKSISGDGAA